MITTKTMIYERMSRNLQTSFADLHSQSKSSLVRDVDISIADIQTLTITFISFRLKNQFCATHFQEFRLPFHPPLFLL